MGVRVQIEPFDGAQEYESWRRLVMPPSRYLQVKSGILAIWVMFPSSSWSIIPA